MLPDSSKKLLLCCTPLQCRIAISLIEQKVLSNFDFIYLASRESKLILFYYEAVEKIASKSYFLKLSQSKFNIISSLFLVARHLPRINASLYSEVFLASIDNILFRFIISVNKSLKISTFDDGLANITHPRVYQGSDYKWRDNLYDCVLKLALSVPTAENIRSKISRHFTIYGELENIVDSGKLWLLPVFDLESSKLVYDVDFVDSSYLVIFLGQPFNEYMNACQQSRLKSFLKTIKVNLYAMHPRESKPILPNVPILDTQSLLIEDLVLSLAKKQNIHIIASYSSALLNIPSAIAKKTYVSVLDDNQEKNRRNLMEKAGCSIAAI